MKNDVLEELPPVSEIMYHCQLSDVQQEFYRSYAASARDELVTLVERDGFDKVQIHVLATLTRLKQICCHPAIFAKEKAEPGILQNMKCFSSFCRRWWKVNTKRSFSANIHGCCKSCAKILKQQGILCISRRIEQKPIRDCQKIQ